MIPDPKNVAVTSSRFLREFQEFISRGNVVDLAIGVIMGAAFGKIVTAQKDGAAILSYGSFINTIIEFIIISACVFALVKAINTLRRNQLPATAAPTKSEELLTEIRDLLKK